MLTAVAFSASAQAADATGQASAFIQNPIVMSEDVAMDFALINADPSGDVVTLTTNGGRSAANASTFGGTSAAGVFSASGTPNAALSLSFSTGDVLQGPGDDMNLGNFAHDAGANPSFNSTGELDFNVGADLEINAAQVGGAYSGSYTVTLDYQ